jgi:hypothetical protein
MKLPKNWENANKEVIKKLFSFIVKAWLKKKCKIMFKDFVKAGLELR